MKAIARIRTLAAICALLSFLTAGVLAGVPGRPIDRPEGPPDPTTEVGDPDQPSGMIVVIGYRTMIIRLPRGFVRLLPMTLRQALVGAERSSSRPRGFRNAR
jgi:hypothetical protein